MTMWEVGVRLTSANLHFSPVVTSYEAAAPATRAHDLGRDLVVARPQDPVIQPGVMFGAIPSMR